MRRLGFLSGKLYPEGTSADKIEECAKLLDWKEPIDENEKLIELKRKELRHRCHLCPGLFACKERLEKNGHTTIPRPSET